MNKKGVLNFLVEVSDYFGRALDVLVVETQDPEIGASIIPTKPAVLLLGKDWEGWDYKDQEEMLLHESIHFYTGLADAESGDKVAHRLGFYSEPEKDVFTRRVLEDMKSGTKRFSPARFGLKRTKALSLRGATRVSTTAR